MQLDDPAHEPIVTVSQGVHIVVDQHFFPGNNAMIIPATDDGRVLFAVPWHNKVVIGTTDTALTEILIEPKPLKEEIDFIISHINRYFTSGIKHSDVRTIFAGLRPLISIRGKKNTSILPRDHTTLVSSSGMVTITGGKWTTYRTMGKNAVDNAASVGKLDQKPCLTASLPIHGSADQLRRDDHLSIYGADAAAIIQLMHAEAGLEEKIHPDLPYTKAEVAWAVLEEMAINVEDVLSRRTRALILDAKAAIASAPIVAALMAKQMNQPAGWAEEQVNNFKTIANKYLID
jgi:glycerol-3-phosphate dehydrogenase